MKNNMELSPFTNIMDEQSIQGYTELFELIGNTPQEKAKYYERRVNDALANNYTRKYIDPRYKREYCHIVRASMIHEIDGVSFGEIEYEPAYQTSVRYAQERYDEVTEE